MANLKSVGAFVLTALLCCSLASTTRAEFGEAKRHFESLTNDERITETLGLIATGDFQGLLGFGFTKYYYGAVTAFQSRSGYAQDGILTPEERAKLVETANPYYEGLQAQYVQLDGFGSRMLVPKALFNLHTSSPTGETFEREDKALSLWPAAGFTDTELRCFDGTGGFKWKEGSSAASSSLWL